MKKVALRKSLFILPNLFTLSSVLCGYYAVLLSSDGGQESFHRAALLIVFAMFFDTIDGRVARLTKTQSAIGVQLDSLADVMSFGMAPAVLVYHWSLRALGTAGILIAFAYVACGCIRLARFNVISTGEAGAPKKPGKYILGLPIPAAAGILISIVLANNDFGRVSGTPTMVAAVVIALSFFMVSTVKFRSFKDLKLNVRTAAFVAFATGSTAFIALTYGSSLALVWLLASYVVIGLTETLIGIATRMYRRGRNREPEEQLHS